MRFSEVLAASALVAPLVAAHGDHIPGMPKIFGLGAGVKARDFPGFAAARRSAQPMNRKHSLSKRQEVGGVDGRCGPDAGGASCSDGYCCSPSGWCGNTEEYCAAPDCLIDFGTGCDALKVPNGESTKDVPRPQLGDVEYGGEGIYPCVEPGTIALTYDDGPYIYTNGVLDQFKEKNMKATFFITGNNLGKGAIDDASTPWPAVIQRMIAEGHQVASHTWSHQDLSAITQQQRIDQMVHNEMAIRNIIQKFPTYMRPPYSSCTAACQADLAALGYVVTYFDLDTTDYLNETPDKIQNAKNVFNKAVGNSDPSTDKFLAIGHDIHQQTAQNLTGYMLQMVQDKGYRGVTVGECLGDPEANWYRASSGKIVTSSSGSPSATASSTSSAAPTATPTGTTQDGTCGSAVGLSCIGFPDGTCCSQYGYCGSTTNHCGTGCQSGFGTCGSSNNATEDASTTATSAAPTATPSNLVTSPDASCGGNTGYTCIGSSEGECCSPYGYCGKSADHCGTGCNPLFGNCGGSAGSSSTSAVGSAQPTTTSSSTVVSSTGTTTAVPTATPTPSEPAPEEPAPEKPIPGGPAPGGPAPGEPAPGGPAPGEPAPGKPAPGKPAPGGPAPGGPAPDKPAPGGPAPDKPAPGKPAPAPAGPAISKNGRCGSRNGGTTCKGYKSGWFAEECCRFDGRCGAGLAACGVGCQKGFGNCWW